MLVVKAEQLKEQIKKDFPIRFHTASGICELIDTLSFDIDDKNANSKLGTDGVHNLYFISSNNEYRLLGKQLSYEEATQEINKFLDNHNYKSYYSNIFECSEGLMIDVGSYSEFFLWGEEEEKYGTDK